jgi:predicted RNase H-like HicB family nuclease
MLYPIAIEKGSQTTAFGVVVPDLPGCFSAGDSFEQALLNAKEAIEFHLESLAELGELPPQATAIDDHFNKEEFTNWVWALTDINCEPYMGKASKINVTLPNLLTKKIDDLVSVNSQYKSRSHFLQVAANNEFKLLG